MSKCVSCASSLLYGEFCKQQISLLQLIAAVTSLNYFIIIIILLGNSANPPIAFKNNITCSIVKKNIRLDLFCVFHVVNKYHEFFFFFFF